MRRRELIVMLAAAAAWPHAARTEQAQRVRRIFVVTNVADSDVDERSRLSVFREELRKFGWIEEQNIRLEYRWTAASVDLLEKSAAEIVGSKPDLIFVVGTTTVSTVLKKTRSIPVVFVTGADPVRVGFVKSMAQPGGNATGVADFEAEIGAKWLQLLREIAPAITRVVFLHSDSRASLLQLPSIQRIAVGMGVSVVPVRTNNAAEIGRALGNYAGQTGLGLVVPPSSVMAVNRELIIALAMQYRIPAIYQNRRYTADGGLMSYGIDRIEQYRRAAYYVDQVLKGASPAELPVRQSEKFELVLNLKTAKSLGLIVPRILLARADELME
ncbi:MAG: ABC transporter substrate-binding protein [Xanthobacteraceae bacterium]|nr:ABC transporter substrate-binding protein [Xanthobacteraceae bacterium]